MKFSGTLPNSAVLHRFCRHFVVNENRKDAKYQKLAAITHMTIGQYIGDQFRLSHPRVPNQCQPIKPRTICFFQNLQRHLALPRSVQNKIGPDPRVIDRPLWAKLVWAGQHLEVEDLYLPRRV